MNIQDYIRNYQNKGYSFDDARAKICQDFILLGISKSKFKEHITIKGGVVLHNISNDIRRATRDIDLDFIKYSLDDDSIKNFINILNKSNIGVDFEIIGRIKPLHHQDYDGKRISLIITDKFNHKLETKVDIGVEKDFNLDQDEYCFNLDIIEGKANLLINSKEQIFSEKLKSLLKLGFNSTRYKDLFDFYYLINETNLDERKLYECINILIFQDNNMKENSIRDIIVRLKKIFDNPIYKSSLNDPKVNWLDISIDMAIENVLEFLESLLYICSEIN